MEILELLLWGLWRVESATYLYSSMQAPRYVGAELPLREWGLQDGCGPLE